MLAVSLSHSNRPLNGVCGIYLITHIQSGKKYIGQSIDVGRRVRDHRRASNESLISRCIRKYGVEAFTIEIVERCNVDELNSKEVSWIEKSGSMYPDGLNIRTGGERGEALADESRKRISEKLRGRAFSEEHKKNLSVSHVGIKHTAISCAKMSASHRGAKRSDSARAAMSAAQTRRWARERQANQRQGVLECCITKP